MILEDPGNEWPNDCRDWREAIEIRFDDAEPACTPSAIDRHLAECPACRTYREELHAIRSGLCDLPGARLSALPSEVLDAVWVRTVDASSGRRGRRWRDAAIAAAAVLAITTTSAWLLNRGTATGPAEYSEAELARLDRDLHTALVQLGRALRGAERFTVEDVLIGEAAPALRHMPLGLDQDRPSNGG